MYIILEKNIPHFQLSLFSEEKWRFIQSNHFISGVELFTEDYLFQFLENHSPTNLETLKINKYTVIKNPFSDPIYIFKFDETSLLTEDSIFPYLEKHFPFVKLQ